MGHDSQVDFFLFKEFFFFFFFNVNHFFFKSLLKFIIILLLFYVLVFGHKPCEISAPQPGQTGTPALEGKVLTTGPPGKYPHPS